jgi:hypothetical protein
MHSGRVTRPIRPGETISTRCDLTMQLADVDHVLFTWQRRTRSGRIQGPIQLTRDVADLVAIERSTGSNRTAEGAATRLRRRFTARIFYDTSEII